MDQNKLRAYFFYALGEIALVMIGILLALQVNNWNELRKEEQREKVYLGLLHQNLSTDLEFFTLNMKFYETVLESGTRILSYSQGEDIPGYSNWELLVSTFHASQIWPIYVESSTFDELKSAGELSLLSNLTLRDRLGFYYGGGQFRYTDTIGINPPYRKLSRMIIPYHIQGYMWDECHETDGDTQILVPCEPPVSESEALEVLKKMVNNDELMGELNFFMTAIRAGWQPLKEQKELCEFMVQEIETDLKKL
jgi:hypothetical protein